jgi:hypothetical protein
MRREKLISIAVVLGALASLGGDCEDTSNAQAQIIRSHAPRVAEILREDRQKHRQGVAEAARRLAPGFVVEDAATRERQMRYALRHVQEPPRGVPEFIASPMSFLAAVGKDGLVICRDGDEEADRMKGQDFGGRYETVRRALADGVPGYELAEFPSQEEGGESSFSMLFVHPVVREGERVGAVVAGIPLWREAQRLGRQLQVDHASEEDIILWVYAYKGDREYFFGTPEGLDAEVKQGAASASARSAGLATSPGGFTGQAMQSGRWFAFGVLPTPSVAEDVGLIIWRSDPM